MYSLPKKKNIIQNQVWSGFYFASELPTVSELDTWFLSVTSNWWFTNYYQSTDITSGGVILVAVPWCRGAAGQREPSTHQHQHRAT